MKGKLRSGLEIGDDKLTQRPESEGQALDADEK